MCEYCNGNKDTQLPLPSGLDEAFNVLADTKELSCIDFDTMVEHKAKINYCPMCGREL